MPNPLSMVRPDAGFRLASARTYPLRENERLARLAMEGVSSWSEVELNMLRLYLTLAGGASADAAAVFLSIESDGARKNAIAALAERKLTADQRKLFSAILKLTGQKSKERHKLAHWVWGHSYVLPDALLLVDPRWLAAKEPAPGQVEEARAYHEQMVSNIYVYTEADFLRIISDNETVAEHAFLFNWILQGHVANANGELWRKISGAPEIAEILNPPDRARQAPPAK